MILGISGTKKIGKTTLINDIKEMWPKYTTPEKTYRSLGATLDEAGTEDSQRLIRDFMFEQAKELYDRNEYVVHDRTLLDNLVYTMWLFRNTKEISPEFVAESFEVTKEAMHYYDIVFLLPLTRHFEVDVDLENEGVDPQYRTDLDVMFKHFLHNYNENTSLKTDFWPEENASGFVEIFGDRKTRIALISQYLNKNGDIHGEDPPTILDQFGTGVSSDTFGKTDERIPNIQDFI